MALAQIAESYACMHDGDWISASSTICKSRITKKVRGRVELANVARRCCGARLLLGDLEDPMCSHGRWPAMHRNSFGEPPPVLVGAASSALARAPPLSFTSWPDTVLFCSLSRVLIYD